VKGTNTQNTVIPAQAGNPAGLIAGTMMGNDTRAAPIKAEPPPFWKASPYALKPIPSLSRAQSRPPNPHPSSSFREKRESILTWTLTLILKLSSLRTKNPGSRRTGVYLQALQLKAYGALTPYFPTQG